MAKKQDPIAMFFRNIEQNWDKWEPIINVIFPVAFTIFAIVFPIALSEANSMTWYSNLFGILTSISLWTGVICGWLLIRNSGKTTRERFDKLIQGQNKLDNLLERLIKGQNKTNLILKQLAQKIDKAVTENDNRRKNNL